MRIRLKRLDAGRRLTNFQLSDGVTNPDNHNDENGVFLAPASEWCSLAPASEGRPLRPASEDPVWSPRQHGAINLDKSHPGGIQRGGSVPWAGPDLESAWSSLSWITG
jgi:hypothetical protein